MVRTLQRSVLEQNHLLGRLSSHCEDVKSASELSLANPVTEGEDDVLSLGVSKRRPHQKLQSRQELKHPCQSS